MGDHRRAGLTEALVMLAASLATAYVMAPPQERMWLRLSVLSRAHQAADRLARRTGRRAMADELSGRDFQRYGIAFWLSGVRDRLAAALEGQRP
jgi:hypothetical protein